MIALKEVQMFTIGQLNYLGFRGLFALLLASIIHLRLGLILQKFVVEELFVAQLLISVIMLDLI